MGVKSPQILPLIVVYPKTILHIPSIVFFNIFFLFLLISVPQCSNQITTESDDLCSINELFSCGENQICVQLEADQNMGECQCKQGFDKQDDGVRFLCEIVGAFSSLTRLLILEMKWKIVFCQISDQIFL